MLEELKSEARYVHEQLRQPLFSRESLLNSFFFVSVFMLANVIAQRWLGVVPASVLSFAISALTFAVIVVVARRLQTPTSRVLLAAAVIGFLGAVLLPLEPSFAHPPSDSNLEHDTERVDPPSGAEQIGNDIGATIAVPPRRRA